MRALPTLQLPDVQRLTMSRKVCPVTVDPDLVPILARIKAAPAVDYRTMPMDEARAIFTAGTEAFNRAPPPVASVTDLELPGDDGPLRARLYRPNLAEDAPVVVYAHGGGWTFGSIDTTTAPCAGSP